MDQITNFKNQLRAEQWAQVIKDCQASNQTVTSWCEEHNVGIKAYYYWLRKLRASALKSDVVPVELPPEPAPVFKKLEVKTPMHSMQVAVIVHLNNGTTLEVNKGADTQTVQAVLLALQSIC